jgi:hypothetical protein
VVLQLDVDMGLAIPCCKEYDFYKTFNSLRLELILWVDISQGIRI